ncbi:recombinase family protein [Kocuria oceani]|uniref:recombinase family protein n=1 Tax=Kocuria oceani TaxID=988827 RepID=UPI0040356B33
MLAGVEALRARGAGLRVLVLGGVDTATPLGSRVFTVMTALAQVEWEVTRERITGSVVERRAAGEGLYGRRQTVTGAPGSAAC